MTHDGRPTDPEPARADRRQDDVALETGAASGGSLIRAPYTLATLVVLVWAALINLGAILGEAVMLYPNIFRDPPASLLLAREFIVAGGPNDFFPPLGLGIILTAAVAVVLTWRTPSVRWWFVAATVTFVCCEFLLSAGYFWPRNTIMFVDPPGTHPDEYLRQVAAQFETGHWVRVIGAAVTAVASFTGLLRTYRLRVAAQTSASASAAAPGRQAG
jgi:hypothetical protein